MAKKAVILLSGGLDSVTCLAIAKAAGFACYALSFDFGQKHKVELESAKKIAHSMGVIDHKILPLALDQLGGSSLLDKDVAVPDFTGENEIPSTYVPARNTVFLAIALGWAEVINAFDIYIGANFIDYSGYPDCRPEYLASFEAMANLATKAGVEGNKIRINAPLLHLTKGEIIQKGLELGIDYSQTISCYRADNFGRACGSCDSCVYRKKGFLQANVADPTIYQCSR